VLATSPTTAPTKQSFTVDTDTCIFPDAMMRALIKLKYLEAKGLDTTAAYMNFMEQRDLAITGRCRQSDLEHGAAPRPSASRLEQHPR
jgi:hypothetical protein